MSSFPSDVVAPMIDEPIIFRKGPTLDKSEYSSIKSVKRKGESSFEMHLRKVFAWDDKDEFVKVFKDLEVPADEDDDLPSSLFWGMYEYDAVKCASQVICNPRLFGFDISDTAVGKIKYQTAYGASTCKVSTPLHEAAFHGATDIINLLIDARHSPNLRIDFRASESPYSSLPKELKMRDALPLDVALFQFRVSELTEESPSVFKLIANLCCPSSAYRVEAVRLLARMTTDLDQEFFKYINNNNNNNNIQLQCIDDIPEKEKMLELFEVFRTIGDKLSGYIRIKRSKFVELGRVTCEVAALFEDSGFLVKCEDIYIPSWYDVSGSNYTMLPASDQKKISVPRLVSPRSPAQALGGLSFTNKGSTPMHSVPKAVLPCVQVKNQGITGDVSYQLCKHRACSYFAGGLTRVGRLL